MVLMITMAKRYAYEYGILDPEAEIIDKLGAGPSTFAKAMVDKHILLPPLFELRQTGRFSPGKPWGQFNLRQGYGSQALLSHFWATNCHVLTPLVHWHPLGSAPLGVGPHILRGQTVGSCPSLLYPHLDVNFSTYGRWGRPLFDPTASR